MTRDSLRPSRSLGLDILEPATPPTPTREPVGFTGVTLAEGAGAGDDVIRIKLGRLAHADVGLPGRRCRWVRDAGAWQECSASPPVRSAIQRPHATAVGLGTLLLALLLMASWLVGRERVVIAGGMGAEAGEQAAVQAAVGRGAGASAGVGVGKALPPSSVRVPDSTVLDVDGTLPPAAVASGAEGNPVVAQSAPPAPSPVKVPAVSAVPAFTAVGSRAVAPAPARVTVGVSPASDPHGPPGLPSADAVALPTAPSRLPMLVANASVSSAADGRLASQERGGAAARSSAGAQPGATSGRQDGDWRDGTWDAARTVALVPLDSRAGPLAAETPDASQHADAVAMVRPGAAARAAAVDARLGGDALIKRAERPPRGGTRKSSRPRPAEVSAVVAAAPLKKRRGSAPQQEEAEPAEPADAPRPTSAWQRTGHRERLVAIVDTDTVVVPDSRGVPARFRLGDRLPSGARVVRIDPSHGRAETDRGTLFLE